MLSTRPPIVVVLGHVDHGKTTLLDYLRHSNIAAREAGGITQSIRSFQLTYQDSPPITFIDTPGHAAFSQMRIRGSSIADIAILIVAADDGVMPQTIESLQAIKSAGIPYLVAINKADLSTADPDRVKTQLVENDCLLEDFGGTVPAVSISSKSGAGIPDLLELINLITQLNPPQSDPQAPLSAFVLESRLDARRGPMAAIIVREGTLKVGDQLFQSNDIGKARGLLDFTGQAVSSASPSTPVEIIGLSTVPPAGSIISTSPITHNSSLKTARPSTTTEHNIILKTDVAGSLEAIIASLPPEIGVLSSGTGDITENDVLLARGTNTRIVGFNTKISNSVSKLAEVEKVSLSNFKIIYELLKDLDLWLHPVSTEKIIGRGEVLAEFKIGSDRIAGVKVIEGTLERSSRVRLKRNNQNLAESKIKNIRQGKSDVQSVKSGQECGLTFSPYLDFKPGDLIISFA